MRFKLKGWMCYLSKDRALFVAKEQKPHPKQEFFEDKAKSMGIQILIANDPLATHPKVEAISPRVPLADEIVIWRYFYWIERMLLAELKRLKKSDATKKCYDALDRFYFDNNSSVFFIDNLVERLTKLSKLFQEHPRISAKCSHELPGGDFSLDHEQIEKSFFQNAYYKCENNILQISTYVEHKHRLTIIKNAVELRRLIDLGIAEKTSSTIKVFGHEFNLYDILPETFKLGLDTIAGHRYYALYPVFWQWFMFYFGGFILDDLKDKEYELLSSKTGIPVGEIDNALCSAPGSPDTSLCYATALAGA